VGFIGDAVNRVRGWIRQDKEHTAFQFAKGTTASGYPSSGSDLLQAYGYDVLSDYLKLEQDLLSRFVDYEEMADHPLIATALEIYADDATQHDYHVGRPLWLSSPDKTIEEIGEDLFHRTLRIEEEIWSIARTLALYGQNYEELLVTDQGVRGLNYLAPPTVRRIEGTRGELYGFVQDFKGRFGHCLASGSRVWGVSGLTEIQQFDEGKVLGYKPVKGVRPALESPVRSPTAVLGGAIKTLPVVRRHSNGTQRVLRIRTRHREIVVTADHPLLAVQPSEAGRTGEPTWVKAKDLRLVRQSGGKKNIDYAKSAKLVICTRMPAGRVPEWSEIWSEDPDDYTTSWGSQPKKLTLPDRPTPEFCRLFGFLLGDGWLDEGNVCYARGEYPELNDYYDGLLNSYGLTPRIKNDGEQTCAGGVYLARLLVSLGWIQGSHNKRVPRWVYGLPEEHREAFLRGFIDADGWDLRSKAGLVMHQFELANYDLVRDLKNLIDGLGYHCGNIGKQVNKVGDTIHNRRTGKDVVVQTRADSFTCCYSELKFEAPLVAENVISIVDHGEAEVFDLEVDDEAHNFIADGVVVHNSPAEFQQILAMRSAMLQGRSNGQGTIAGMERLSAFEDWEVVHFRIHTKQRRAIYGSCLVGSSRVWTPDGVKAIADIRSGDRVFTRKAGRLQTTKVLDQVCNGVKPVFRVRTTHREITLTANHPLLVDLGGHGKNRWRPVEELRIGDKLVFAARMPETRPPPPLGLRLLRVDDDTEVRLTARGAAALRQQTRESHYSPRDSGLRPLAAKLGITRAVLELLLEGGSAVPLKTLRALFDEAGLPLFEGSWTKKLQDERLRLPDFVEPWFARLYGFLLGDGWLTDGQVLFALGVDEERNKFYEGLLEKCGLPTARSGRYDEPGVETQSYVSSQALVGVLRELGWIDGAHFKRVPAWVYTLPFEHRKEFLEGFIDADGWETYEGKYLHTELCNDPLVRDIKALIDGLGWTSGNVRTRGPRTGVIKRSNGKEKLIVGTGGALVTYHETVLESQEFGSEEIISIDPAGEEAVYDIEVANNEHNFIADGLVVHNSILDSARWIFKRLVLLEDTAMIYRLTRGAERFAYYVDTGNLPPAEALAYLNRVRQQNKKKKYVNNLTGKMDLKHSILNQQDDVFVPTRQGVDGTRIEVLGAPSWQSMEDIQYFLDQLFAAIKVPKSYLAQDQSDTHSSLSSRDVRFARTILRVQRELRNGFAKIMRVHLAALGIDPNRVDYSMHMTVPSAIFELAQMEVLNARADLCGRLREMVSLHYLLSTVLKLSDEEIALVMRQREEEADEEATIQARTQSMIQKAVAAAGMEGQAQGQIDTTQAMNAAGMQTPQQQQQQAQAAQMAQQQQAQAQQAQAAQQAARKESRIGGPLIRIRDGVRPVEYYGLERRLFEGEAKSRADRSRLESKLDRLGFTSQQMQEKLRARSHEDRMIHSRLRELGGLVRDLNIEVRGLRRY